MEIFVDLISSILEFGSDIIDFILSFLETGVSIMADEPVLGVLFILLTCKLVSVVKDVFD